MASRDDKLERLKRRKMLELQKRMLTQRQKPEEPPKLEEPTPDDVFNTWLVGRAWEVLRAARAQFPQVMPQVEGALLEALKAGRVKQNIDGESLFQFLRQIGVPVRLQTSIRYKDHGELKTIGQLMKEKE
jgi:DNA-binding TFAR19-related protein (PDSD5 family)